MPPPPFASRSTCKSSSPRSTPSTGIPPGRRVSANSTKAARKERYRIQIRRRPVFHPAPAHREHRRSRPARRWRSHPRSGVRHARLTHHRRSPCQGADRRPLQSLHRRPAFPKAQSLHRHGTRARHPSSRADERPAPRHREPHHPRRHARQRRQAAQERRSTAS